jgi:hypothetical protein
MEQQLLPLNIGQLVLFLNLYMMVLTGLLFTQLKARQVPQDHRAQQAQRVLQDLKAPQEPKETQELKVLLDLKEILAPRVRPDLLALPVL